MTRRRSGACKAVRHWAKALGCAAGCALSPFTAWSQAVGVMQAYEAALRNDPAFQVALAERAVGQEHLAIGRAGTLPVVAASAGVNRNFSTISSEGAADERRAYTSNSVNLFVRYPLYNREALAGLRQGQARSDSSAALFTARQQDLIVRTFEAYSLALGAQEDVRLSQAQLDALDGQLRANERLLEKGEGTRTDVLETGAQRALAQSSLIEAQDVRSVANLRLASITGLPVGAVQPLAVDHQPAAEPAQSLAHWRALTQESNGVLRSLRHDVEAARQELARVEAGHSPRVDLLLSTGQNESDTVSTYRQRTRSTLVGLQMNLPLYAGGGVSAQARQAVARLNQAQAELDRQTAEVMVELQEHHARLTSSAQRIGALRQAVAAGQQLLEATRRSVAGGERTNVDVLNARERLFESERDLLKARFLYWLSELRLHQISGTLEPSHLQRIAANFDSTVAAR